MSEKAEICKIHKDPSTVTWKQQIAAGRGDWQAELHKGQIFQTCWDACKLSRELHLPVQFSWAVVHVTVGLLVIQMFLQRSAPTNWDQDAQYSYRFTFRVISPSFYTVFQMGLSWSGEKLSAGQSNR